MGRIFRKLIRTVLFFAIFFTALYAVQGVLVMKWDYPIQIQHHLSKSREYRNLRKDSVQAVFLGTSHVQFSVIPMELYEQEQITSYNAALSGERASAIYYQLRDLLKTQKPACVFLDASPLFFNAFSSEGWSYLLDSGYPYGTDRWQASWQCSAEYREELASDHPGTDLIEHFLPITGYHDRWKELSESDFGPGGDPGYAGKGYALTQIVQPGAASLEEINSAEYKSASIERNLVWLEKMKDLCDRRDVRLCLIKIPVYGDPQVYASAWTWDKSEKTRQEADRLQLDFLDLMYDVDTGLDPMKDFCDDGAHMNYRGAVKITTALGSYLKNELGLTGQEDAYYEEGLLSYDRLKAAALLGGEENWTAYFEKLAGDLQGKTVLLAMSGKKRGSFSDGEKAVLAALGLTPDETEFFGQEAFAAVIRNGRKEIGEHGEAAVRCTFETPDGADMAIRSTGAGQPEDTSILVNDLEYVIKSKGLHVVVYDETAGLVTDSVCFYKETEEAEPACLRDTAAVSRYIQAFEHELYHL